ncbi:hypothetical protein N9I66_10200 [Pseudomonadales bacterium]|nr:hypothetical protein [Pseudomonadales bacterium]
MTHKQSNDRATPGAHQIPLLSDSAPLRRPKTSKPARAPAKSANATKIASRDPAYDPDSLDLFQDVFAALTSASIPTPFTEAQARQLASEYTDQVLNQIRRTIVTDLTEIIDLLDPKPQPSKEPDL